MGSRVAVPEHPVDLLPRELHFRGCVVSILQTYSLRCDGHHKMSDFSAQCSPFAPS
jgi:hypothetical protein